MVQTRDVREPADTERGPGLHTHWRVGSAASTAANAPKATDPAAETKGAAVSVLSSIHTRCRASFHDFNVDVLLFTRTENVFVCHACTVESVLVISNRRAPPIEGSIAI